jgi:hypothetical protein
VGDRKVSIKYYAVYILNHWCHRDAVYSSTLQ